jgi:hypothetical protein
MSPAAWLGFLFTPSPFFGCDIKQVSQVFLEFKSADMLEKSQLLKGKLFF